MSYDYMCSSCDRSDGCVEVVQLVHELVAAAKADRTPLDVLLEMPYVPKAGGEHSARLRAWNALMRQDGGPSKVKKWMAKAAGVTPFYVGVFSQLYKEFKDELYHGNRDLPRGRGGGAKDGPNVRFHYADARSEPNVEAFLPPKNPAALPAEPIASVRALLRAYMFERDFEAALRAIAPGRPAWQARVTSQMHGETLTRTGEFKGAHKVAKQYLKLARTDPALAVTTRAYIEKRIDEVAVILEHDVGVGVLVGSEHAGGPLAKGDPHAAEYDPWLAAVRAARAGYQAQAYYYATRLGSWVILMDAYLLCRMLLFARASPGGTTVVYVGDAHAAFYVRFLREHMRLAPVVARPRQAPTAADASSTSTSSRCISVVQ